MEKAILVGEEIRLRHLASVFENRLQGIEIINIEANYNIKKQENEILANIDNATYIVYDIDQYINDSTELIDTIKSIYRINKAKVILYLPTDNPNTEIVKKAVSSQIKNYVNAGKTLGEQKDQLEKIIFSYYDVNPREDIVKAEKVAVEETKTLNDFVESLYDAKQREDQKEKTIIIKKKKNSEIFIEVIVGIVKTLLMIISILLMSIALITLIYTSTREAFFAVLNQIVEQILSMI